MFTDASLLEPAPAPSLVKDALHELIDLYARSAQLDAAIAKDMGGPEPISLDYAKGIKQPNDEQIEIIRRLTGVSSEKEDWLCIGTHASDCLVDKSDRAWSYNVLQQMTGTYEGKQIMTDHRWSAEAAIGFLIQPKILTEKAPSSEILDLIGKGEYNREIVRQHGGMHWLNAVAVIPADLVDADKIRDRRYHYMSTGGSMRDVRYICPNCSREKGREVGFFDKNPDQTNACPHVMPSPYIQWAKQRGWIDKDVPVADYAIIDGTYRSVELSFVLNGALPAAGVLR